MPLGKENYVNSTATSRFRKDRLPPPGTFYRNELGELRREDSRGWTKPRAGCPFHASESKTSFAVNLRTGAYHCFGCDASGGDVVSFLMRRYSLTFKAAAQRLGAWDDALQLNAVVIHQVETERRRQEQERQAEKDREHQERIRARTWLHRIERIYHEAVAGLRPDDEVGWAIAALAFDEVIEAEAAYLQMAGLA